MSSSSRELCVFRILDGPVKEFVLAEASPEAAKALFDLGEKVLEDAALKQDLRALAMPTLIDTRVGVQPIGYCMQRLRDMMRKYPETRRGSFIAVILPHNPALRALTALTRPIGNIRIYMPDERDEALAWLQANKP